MTPDKRRFVRYETGVRIELEHRGRRHAGRTDDLGAGGCRVAVPWPMEKGSPVEVALGEGPHARGRATVAWATAVEPYRVGLAFADDLAEQTIVLIHGLLGAVAIKTGEG